LNEHFAPRLVHSLGKSRLEHSDILTTASEVWPRQVRRSGFRSLFGQVYLGDIDLLLFGLRSRLSFSVVIDRGRLRVGHSSLANLLNSRSHLLRHFWLHV